jgi:hypothetical protein
MLGNERSDFKEAVSDLFAISYDAQLCYINPIWIDPTSCKASPEFRGITINNVMCFCSNLPISVS